MVFRCGAANVHIDLLKLKWQESPNANLHTTYSIRECAVEFNSCSAAGGGGGVQTKKCSVMVDNESLPTTEGDLLADPRKQRINYFTKRLLVDP